LIAEQVTDSVLTTDLQYCITYANRSFQRIFGYSPEEILGMSPDILNAEPDTERIQKEIYDCVSQGKSWRGELLNRRKDGSTFPCEMTIMPLINARGETLAFAGIQRDVTERKKAEDKLLESEQKFRAIFDQTFEFIGLLNLDGTLLAANKPSLEFGGLEEQDVIGEPFWETPWWTHSPDIQDQLRQAIGEAAKGELARFEAWHPKPNGEISYVDVSIKPVKDDEGNVVLLIPEGRDITERKKAENELAMYRDHLEEVVAERTRELTETGKALQEAHRRLLVVREDERQKLAAELHDSVGQKLVAIRMFAESVASVCEGNEHLKAHAETLHEASRQCADTIREIRTICCGLYPLALESMGLGEALNHLGQSCDQTICFTMNCEQPLMEARHSREQEIALFRIAQEAVSNTLKHSQASNLSISLEKKGSTLDMAVCDDGIGFDTESVPRTTLGLYLMKERAEAIGGNCTVTSRNGETTVKVSVPVEFPESKEAGP
jgi:PAS domain S-box-containing protein